MNTINYKRNAELRDEKRIRELRVQRLERSMKKAALDSDDFRWLVNEIVTEEKWIRYYNILLNDPNATEEIAWLTAFGEARR